MQKEKLSQLLDGETEHIKAEFVTKLASNKELKQSWHNYHLIGAVIRNELNNHAIRLDLSERIAVALEQEPILLQPKINVVPALSPIRKSFSRRRVWPFLSQVSIAASIALVTVIGVQHYNAVDVSSDAPVFNTVPVAMNVSAVGYHPEQSNNGVNLLFQQDQLKRVKVMLNNYELQRRIHN